MKTLYEYKNDDFVASKASEQNAIDLFKGDWISSLPGVKAGGMALFDKDNDVRPRFVTDRFGPIKGWNVLELGSFEGGHTYQLENEGASVTAIEANPYIFLRSLIAKNIYNLNAKFLLGDFTQYLGNNPYTTNPGSVSMAQAIRYHVPSGMWLLFGSNASLTNCFCYCASETLALPQFEDNGVRQVSLAGGGTAGDYQTYGGEYVSVFDPSATDRNFERIEGNTATVFVTEAFVRYRRQTISIV